MKTDRLIQFVLCVGLLAGLGLPAFRRWSRRRREREAQAAFAQHLADQETAAREQFAAEIHDGLGHRLVLLRNAALTALAQPGSPPAVQVALSQISSLASNTLDEARAIAERLQPVDLERLGFSKAVDELLARHLADPGIRVFKDVDDLSGAASPPAMLYLYRLVESLVRDLRTQVEVRTVLFEVKLEPEAFRIRLEHDGQRPEPGAGAPPAGGGEGTADFAVQVRLIPRFPLALPPDGRSPCLERGPERPAPRSIPPSIS